MTPVDLRVTLPADPRSPAAARQLVRRSLTQWGLVAFSDDAELLVSELVTNAVLHARSETEVAVTADGDRVHVEVCDGSPVLPRTRPHSLTATTGRGVRMLEALAAAWGVVSTGSGKCVWFALDRRHRMGDRGVPWGHVDLDAVEPL